MRLLIIQLEEGEVDVERARQYSFCFKRQHRKDTEAKMEKMRREAAERRALLMQKRDPATAVS
jgi:hypothetical protein